MTTIEGLPAAQRDRWADAFVATGASQCGFCTPGIVLRLAALEAAGPGRAASRRDVEGALRAHLCRCTGWQSILEAAERALGPADGSGRRRRWRPARPVTRCWPPGGPSSRGRPSRTRGPTSCWAAAGSPTTARRRGPRSSWAPTPRSPPDLRAARAATGRVQGRNSTVPLTAPVPVPDGQWALTLQTTWVEPAYVEPDASWCRPGGRPASPLANGGAFGGKRHSPVPARARALADETGGPVRVLWRREDVVRRGPKRPPLAVALRPDGTGVVRVGRSPGSADLAPAVERVRGPVSRDRGRGGRGGRAARVARPARGRCGPRCWRRRRWCGRRRPRPGSPGEGGGVAEVTVPGGGRARVEVRRRGGPRGRVDVEVWAGEVLCPVTLRSYVLGAVHQALGLVWSEGIVVDEAGEPVDLTIRSFGILAARDMPEVNVTVHEEDRWPVNGSDAVFVATLAAAWSPKGGRRAGRPAAPPCGRPGATWQHRSAGEEPT